MRQPLSAVRKARRKQGAKRHRARLAEKGRVMIADAMARNRSENE